jgi:hypothetical protein
MVEQAGLSEAPAREPRPRSFIVASRELWDCVGQGLGVFVGEEAQF